MNRFATKIDDRGKLCVPNVDIGLVSVKDSCGPVSYCHLDGPMPTCRLTWWFIACIVVGAALLVGGIACGCCCI